ncbi:Ark- serine/threonine protein kinase [Paramecium bursaria]
MREYYYIQFCKLIIIQQIYQMKQLIENYTKLEQYCKKKQKELKDLPDLYDETNLDHLNDREYQNLIINVSNQYQLYHPLIIKNKLRLELIEDCNIKGEIQSTLQLLQYKLTCQQALQYLLSILNFILNKDENQKLVFYSNPQIKIKCHSSEAKFYKTQLNQIDLKNFQSYIIEFIQYLQNPIIFDSQAIQIIQILMEYKQPSLEQFKKSIRNLYTQLIQYLDLKKYLKQELLYEIKDKTSVFIYKLNQCNYSICFNDNRLKDPNGSGFLPVLQNIKGYKGFGNLLMINARENEWQNAKIHNCQYEMLLIYKKLSNASFHLFKQKMQFRYIANHQIIKFYQSYRILYHNLENSTYNYYIDHHRNFLYLFEQFLLQNKLDTIISRQFKQLIDLKLNQVNIFLEQLKSLVDQVTKQMIYQEQKNKSESQQLREESKNQIISDSINQLQKNLLKILSNISKQIQEWINTSYRSFILKRISISNDELEQFKIVIIRQLEVEKIEQLILQLDYFNVSKFELKLLIQSSQSTMYLCKHKLTQRKFVLGLPQKNYDYSELGKNIQIIHSQIPKGQRKGICKVFKIDQIQMWMEYSNTGNLMNYLNTSNLHYFEIILVCFQISEIISELHNAKIYHLDIKLDNFLVFKKYGLNRIKICDFGSMTCEDKFQFNIEKHRMVYSPPEAKQNETIQSQKFDIWQLGKVFSDILKKIDKGIQIPQFFSILKHDNPELRPKINKVLNQIREYKEKITYHNVEYNLVQEKFCQYFSEQFMQNQQQFQLQNNFQNKNLNHEIRYCRQYDKQNFQLVILPQKCEKQFLANNNFLIYDILPSIQNWTSFCLFRQEKQIQEKINLQYWSILQKSLFLIKFFLQFKMNNYFQQNELEDDEFLSYARQYADNLRLIQQDDAFQYNEGKYMIKIIIFESLVIDLFSFAFNKSQILLQFKEVVHDIFKRNLIISNKNQYFGNIESILFLMLDLNLQLPFQSKDQKKIKIYGYLYLANINNQKYYLQLTKEQINSGQDQFQVYLNLISQNQTEQEKFFINFQKINYNDFQLFKLDYEKNFQLYIKFVVQQTILNYQGNHQLESPFNLIEGVFINKRNQSLIKNDIYVPLKDLDDNINLIKYVVQIFYQQLKIIGSLTFRQKLKDRLQQLSNCSLSYDNNLSLKEKEKVFIKLLLKLDELKKILGIQQQLDLLYYMQDHWNYDFVNLILLCKNLKENTNYNKQNEMNHSQHYYSLNKNSNFEYYVSIENLSNATKLYQAFIQSQLVKVIIYQQKKQGIIQSNQKRILIDQIQSVSLSQFLQNKTQDQNNSEILKYDVYLEIQSMELNQICQQFKIYSLFDWINLIECLLNKFDVYTYYQYLETQYGKDLIIKLLILLKCYKVFNDQNIKELQVMILLFKQKDEYKYLLQILNLFKNLYNHNNILTISKNILELRLHILNMKYNNFAFFDNQIQQNQLNTLQLNQVAYLAYFLFVNEVHYQDLYYDIDEQKIYLDYKRNTFHIKYDLLFQDGKLNRTLQHQLIVAFLRNFQFYINQEKDKQMNYIINQYDFNTKLEQLDFQIIKRLNYVAPQRIYIINQQQNLYQQYLCCYYFGQEFLDYNNFKVVQNQNPLDYHCRSIVKLEGQIVRIKHVSRNIKILNKIIFKMKNLAKILFNQGFQFDILETNLVIVINQSNVQIYPVEIKKTQNQLIEISNSINDFQHMILKKNFNQEEIALISQNYSDQECEDDQEEKDQIDEKDQFEKQNQYLINQQHQQFQIVKNKQLVDQSQEHQNDKQYQKSEEMQQYRKIENVQKIDNDQQNQQYLIDQKEKYLIDQKEKENDLNRQQKLVAKQEQAKEQLDYRREDHQQNQKNEQTKIDNNIENIKKSAKEEIRHQRKDDEQNQKNEQTKIDKNIENIQKSAKEETRHQREDDEQNQKNEQTKIDNNIENIQKSAKEETRHQREDDEQNQKNIQTKIDKNIENIQKSAKEEIRHQREDDEQNLKNKDTKIDNNTDNIQKSAKEEIRQNNLIIQDDQVKEKDLYSQQKLVAKQYAMEQLDYQREDDEQNQKNEQTKIDNNIENIKKSAKEEIRHQREDDEQNLKNKDTKIDNNTDNIQKSAKEEIRQNNQIDDKVIEKNQNYQQNQVAKQLIDVKEYLDYQRKEYQKDQNDKLNQKNDKQEKASKDVKDKYDLQDIQVVKYVQDIQDVQDAKDVSEGKYVNKCESEKDLFNQYDKNIEDSKNDQQQFIHKKKQKQGDLSIVCDVEKDFNDDQNQKNVENQKNQKVKKQHIQVSQQNYYQHNKYSTEEQSGQQYNYQEIDINDILNQQQEPVEISLMNYYNESIEQDQKNEQFYKVYSKDIINFKKIISQSEKLLINQVNYDKKELIDEQLNKVILADINDKSRELSGMYQYYNIHKND